MKKFLIMLGSFVALMLVVCAFEMHAWRLFGFRLCTSPDELVVMDVDVEGGYAYISGAVRGSVFDYAGYISRVEPGAVYVGVKHSRIFGSGGGGYEIAVPCGDEISEIYFADGQISKCIWRRDDNRMKQED